MNTHHLSLCIFILFLLLPLKLFAAEAAGQNDENIKNEPLEISIAVPLHHDKRNITLHKPHGHFHVLLTNNSNQPIKLWREWCSWGHSNLKFEITDNTGKTCLVKKNAKGWDKNFPDYVSLEAHCSTVIDVDFNPEIWENPPQVAERKSINLTMKALFQIQGTDESQKLNVWTGSISSESKVYTFYHW